MRRVGTEEWAGLAMLVVAVAVAAPVLLGTAGTTIPKAWWVVLFAGFLLAVLVATARTSPPIRYCGFGLAVLAAWAVVLTASGTGLLVVYLVITAAVSVYVVPLRVGLLVVALNTGVAAVASARIEPETSGVVIVTGFYLLIQLATLLSTATLLREQRTRRELTEAHVELREASILLSESARTTERLRISRELHDLIGHQLTVLTLELETARHLDGVDAREHIERADDVARGLLRDVRATVGQLRAEAPDLEQALRTLVHALPGLDVSIDVSPRVSLGEEQSAALVRAAQEIVTNTIRHAEARELWIEVSADDGGTVLRARDDGRGAAEPVLGNGLLGLRERFGELGGTVTVDGRNGFLVTAQVPAR